MQILKRLARKRIGPRLLGTFTNGRFEEFFHARTLTPKDLRIPETSKQIAKRMRELHDGVELEPAERDAGPFVWQNWDKWVVRCQQVICWLDGLVKNYARQENLDEKAQVWKDRGLICGVEWQFFKETVEKYRKWLDEQYGGTKRVKTQLIFSHNDVGVVEMLDMNSAHVVLRLNMATSCALFLPANRHCYYQPTSISSSLSSTSNTQMPTCAVLSLRTIL